MLNTPPFQIRLDPPGAGWSARVAERLPSPTRRRFREQMGLPAEGPLILTGHQPDLWHCGILAKHFASLALRDRMRRAGRAGACCCWLVVDQDEVEKRGLRIPIRDRAGALRESWWGFAPQRIDGVPLTGAGLNAIEAMEWRGKEGEHVALGCIGEGIAAARRELNSARPESSSWAEQISRAAGALIVPHAEPPAFVYESRMAGTDVFRVIVEAIPACGAEFIRAYNAACRDVPDAGLRPLDESRGELPLWEVVGGVRRRVFLNDLQKKDAASLAPRALLMTAILRAAGCEIFIHGTGGGVYDRAMEAWARAWPGPLASILSEAGGLAPMVVASANMRLPLADQDFPGEAEIARAVWRAHHARHDPALLGDAEAARQKEALVRRIAERRRMGQHPAAEFGELQTLLRRVRSGRELQLRQHAQSAAEFAAKRSESRLANDRAWSFVLHPKESLRVLRDAFFDALAGA